MTADTARTHARARAPRLARGDMRPEVGEVVLPGDLPDWTPPTYRARYALALAVADPLRAAIMATDCDDLDAGAILTRCADRWLLAGDPAAAAATYRRARHAVELDVTPAARILEAAALYGAALVAVAMGRTFEALTAIDEGLATIRHNERGAAYWRLRRALVAVGDAITTPTTAENRP